jgi:hypothetical protein
MGDVNAICEQRKQFQLFNIPPIRLEVISPYPAFTQEQLNMRRKTEILKYNKNSTQGPRLTQKQKLAATFRGGYNAARVVCPSDYNIPVLTTAAGVPGPPIYLVEDPNVPLYNYVKDTNAYAENNYEDNTQWIFTTNTNQLCPNNNTYIEIAKLIIRKPIQQSYTQFTYQTPVLFRLKGTALPANCAGSIISATIDPTLLKFQVLYNTTAVPNNLQLTSRFLHLNYSNGVGTDYNNLPIAAQLSPPLGTTGTFNYFCETYVGILEISGIILTTSPGFVYGFNINYILNKNALSPLSNQFDKSIAEQNIREKTVFELYANIADSYTVLPSSNCILRPGSILVNPPEKKVVFTGIPI